MHSYLCTQDLFCTSSVRTVGPVTHLSHDKGRYLATGKPCAFYLFKHSNSANSLSWVEQTERHKAAVLSLNESFSSLRALLCSGVFLLFPGLLIRPPALPLPNLEPHRWVLRWEEAHLLLCVPTLSFANTHRVWEGGEHTHNENWYFHILSCRHTLLKSTAVIAAVRLLFTSKRCFQFKQAPRKTALVAKFFIHKWQQSGVSSREGGGAICCHIARLLCLWAC